MPNFVKLLDPDDEKHVDYVQRMVQMKQHFQETTVNHHRAALAQWDLFLAEEEDTRDPVDELWRSQIVVPLPFSTTRAKTAQQINLLGNTEPVWSVEASREEKGWYEEAKSIERLVEYAHANNAWRKFLSKLLTMRSVMGTVPMKLVWRKRAHTLMAVPNNSDQARFLSSIEGAVSRGAPQPPHWATDREGFELWRKTVNTAGLHGEVLAVPRQEPGLEEVVEYEGPSFQTPSLWSVFIDPLIDEMANQPVIIHRVVKPLSTVLAKADNSPDSDKPYLLKNIEKAMERWGGEILTKEEQELAEKMGMSPQKESHPYYREPVVLWEVYSFDETFKYAVIMNERAVINKSPFNHPLLTTSPNIQLLRNILVPGHAYGLSDYHEPRYLFQELNRFRRLRMDRATLTTLPVFVKQSGVRLTEVLRKLHPGMIVETPGKPGDSLKALVDATVPPEAYREPQEIKLEIEDATETPGYAKGLAATVGRVTSTEFSGRAQQVDLKFKVDTGFIEDELEAVPRIIVSMFAQMSSPELRFNIGGNPDAVTVIPRDKLMQALTYKFRMRGATKHLDPTLAMQQLMTAVRSVPPNILTPIEYRAFLQWLFEIQDIRGWQKVLSPEGTQQVQAAAQTAGQAANAQSNATAVQATAAANPAPPTLDPGQAAALSGGGNGQGQ